MKKILLATLASISFTFAVQAQFKVGIIGGGSRVSQRVNSKGAEALYSNDHFKTYHAGFIADMPVTERISLQPKLLYSQKGSTLLSATGSADARVRMKTIELPVTVVYKFPVSFGKLFGGAGAGFSYALSGQQTQNGQQKNLYKDLSGWRREDISYHLSAGVEFNNGLFASISSQKSLLDAYKPDGVSVKNRSTSVSLGYLINWNAFKRKR
ncbi:MAG TPA: porin family protein [Chitinophagaceae bacterium]|nr:porin family protein [Chitinophagaceae bacterium]